MKLLKQLAWFGIFWKIGSHSEISWLFFFFLQFGLSAKFSFYDSIFIHSFLSKQINCSSSTMFYFFFFSFFFLIIINELRRSILGFANSSCLLSEAARYFPKQEPRRVDGKAVSTILFILFLE